MVTVVIPVLNEEATVGSVVDFAKSETPVESVVVVDDASTDNTAEVARAAGARVVQSTLLGKGASMSDGIVSSLADCIVFLDGDLQGLQRGLVEKLARPILSGAADFVKAGFERSGGRVTVLTVKPLLQAFFPELTRFSQPIGGIMAARRDLLLRLDLEHDYGVDVGLLIDAHMAGARIHEVDMGFIEHDSQDLESLGRMANQVVRVILDRAQRYGRMDGPTLLELREAERQLLAGLQSQSFSHREVRPLVLLSVDNIILEGELLQHLALHTGHPEVLDRLRSHDPHDPDSIRSMALMFADVPLATIENTARLLPLKPGAVDAIKELRRQGFRIGLVGGLFHSAVEVLRRRVYAHLCFAHVARRSGERGQIEDVNISREFSHARGCPSHRICPGNVVANILEHYGMQAGQVISVGAGPADECLLRATGHAIVFKEAGDAEGLHPGPSISRLRDLPGACGALAAAA